MLEDLKQKQAIIDNLTATISTLQNLIDSTVKSDPLLQNLKFMEKLVHIETDDEIQEKNRDNVRGFFYNSMNYNAGTSLPTKDDVDIDTVYRESKELINSVSQYVGVQVMNGPVGVVWAISYQNTEMQNDNDSKPANTLSLEVRSIATEAVSRIIQEKTITEAINDMLVGIILKYCKRTKIKSDAGTNALQSQLHVLGSDIARNTRRGAGNVLMCSEKTLTQFNPSTSYRNIAIVNNSVPDNIIIVCYVGSSHTDRGLFFNPYLLHNRKVPNGPNTIKQDLIRYGLAYNTDWENYYQILEIIDAK